MRLDLIVNDEVLFFRVPLKSIHVCSPVILRNAWIVLFIIFASS